MLANEYRGLEKAMSVFEIRGIVLPVTVVYPNLPFCHFRKDVRILCNLGHALFESTVD